MAFFALSQGPLPYLADELLLLIQPLSVLTFHLDLLFEHHHLSMDVRPLSRRPQSPPCPAHGSAPGPGRRSLGGLCSVAGPSLEDQTPRDAVGPQQPHAAALVPGAQVGAALQQTLQHVLRWGDRLSRTLLGTDGSPAPSRPEPGPGDAEAGPRGWWGQLGRASRTCSVPSKEKLPSVWWMKLRAAAADPSPGPALPPLGEPSGTELRLLQTKAVPELPSPQPSSSAGTSGSSSPEALILSAGAGASPAPSDPAAGESPRASPGADGSRASPPGPRDADRGRWLGRLFGASSPSARSFPPSPDAASARSR